MRNWHLILTVLIGASCVTGMAQIRRTEVPMGDAISIALTKISLTGSGARPFHLRLNVSEPQNSNSPYQGTIEEWWASPDQWRREVTTKSSMKQVIVFAGGQKTETDEGDYFPQWLRRFVLALIDPVPGAGAWAASHLMIEQVILPNGDRSDPCARAKGTIGTGDRATDSFSNVCFDSEGRLKFVGSPSYSMEFQEYKKFEKKQIARKLVDHPEPGTELVGEVAVLEDLKENEAALFSPLSSNQNRFEQAVVGSEQLERLSAENLAIKWPTVRSGNTQGHLAIYISADSQGQVREAWPLNSDNAGLDDSVRDQVRKWKLKPAVDKNGNRVQVEGGLGFSFGTRVANALPELDNTEVRALAVRTVNPIWPSSGLTHGQTIKIEVSVDEQGKLAGFSMGSIPPAAAGPVMNAIHQWRFRPFIRDGKPQYFHGVVVWTVN